MLKKCHFILVILSILQVTIVYLVCYSLLIISCSTDSATRALGAWRTAAGSALFTRYQRSLHRWLRRR